MAKRRIIRIEDLSEDGQKLFDVLNEGADLAVVLIATSYLDASLGSILHRFFLESEVSDQILAVRGGALGTFAVRADLCYVLGIISRQFYQDLRLIGSIRNEFAHHHLALTFDTPSVRELCNQFVYIESLRDSRTKKPILPEELLVGARNRFVLTVTIISQRLLLTGLGIKRRTARRNG